MTIQILGQNILIRDGVIATNEDCCCEEPCIECQPCPTCWSSELAPCNALDSFDITISGVTSRAYTDCTTCTSANATFSFDIPTYGCQAFNYRRWQMLTCVVPFFRYTVDLDAQFLFTTEEIPIVSTTENPLKICNSYTVKKGHYVKVTITERRISRFSEFYIAHEFYYSFDNHAIKPGCPDDQAYGLCTGLSSGGIATHVADFRGSPRYAPDACFEDLGKVNPTLYIPFCDFSNVQVQIGAVQVSVGP
jgi:hypothetical protein